MRLFNKRTKDASKLRRNELLGSILDLFQEFDRYAAATSAREIELAKIIGGLQDDSPMMDTALHQLLTLYYDSANASVSHEILARSYLVFLEGVSTLPIRSSLEKKLDEMGAYYSDISDKCNKIDKAMQKRLAEQAHRIMERYCVG